MMGHSGKGRRDRNGSRSAGAMVERLEMRALLSAAVSGIVFNDLNGDGLRDTGEPTLSGFSVERSGVIKVTDADGHFAFAADEGLTAPVPFFRDGWTYTGPQVIPNTPDGPELHYELGMTDLGFVGGYAFFDTNANELRDANELPAPGVTVYADANVNGLLEPGEFRGVTGADGSYQFGGMERGASVTIREVVPLGYALTTNYTTGGARTVQLIGRPAVTFGNYANSPVAATAPGAQTAAEGVAQSFDLGSFADPDGRGPWGVTVDWGDGKSIAPSFVFPPLAVGSLGTATHTYDDNGNYTVTVAISDYLPTGGFNVGARKLTTSTATFQVAVSNAAPAATLSIASPVYPTAFSSVALAAPQDAKADTAAGFTYSFDIDGDGVFELANVPDAYVTVPATLLAAPGTRTVHARITDKDGASTDYSAPLTVLPPPTKSAPVSGSPAILYRFLSTDLQAEYFDVGGEGVAWHDTDAVNQGGTAATFRAAGVDVSGIGNPLYAEHALTFIRAGEWVNYTVEMQVAGNYEAAFRVSHLLSGGKLHLELDGQRVGGQVTVPKTGAWDAYQTVTLKGLNLPAGVHVLRVVFDSAGGAGYVCNLDKITFRYAPNPNYHGQPLGGGEPPRIGDLPASRIEAENYDLGGEGIAYHDLDPANRGLSDFPRPDSVDVEYAFDTGSSYAVAYARAGEWLNYTVDVMADDVYDLDVRLASLKGGGAFHLEIDGVRLMSSLTVPKTGGWADYTTFRPAAGVPLKAGRHILRLAMDRNDVAGYVANFNWIEFTRRFAQ
jgi:hypothetical protein